MAIILQNFNLQLDDPTYKLRIKQTLTVKPKDLYLRAALREGVDPTKLDRALHSSADNVRSLDNALQVKGSANTITQSPANSMTILVGSNTGTCQAFAQRLASDASVRGFAAHVTDMNSGMVRLPRKSPVILITSSYEGQPPDNAARFVQWLESYNGTAMDDVQFAVFGCGHSNFYPSTP